MTSTEPELANLKLITQKRPRPAYVQHAHPMLNTSEKNSSTRTGNGNQSMNQDPSRKEKHAGQKQQAQWRKYPNRSEEHSRDKKRHKSGRTPPGAFLEHSRKRPQLLEQHKPQGLDINQVQPGYRNSRIGTWGKRS